MKVANIDSYLADCQARGITITETTRPPDAAFFHPGPDVDCSEKEFSAAVVALAIDKGWIVHHHFDSRRSEPGWPDLVLIRGRSMLFVELKKEAGKLTEAQADWLRAIRAAGGVALLWKPSHWGIIGEMLK